MSHSASRGSVRRGTGAARKKARNRKKPNYRLLFCVFMVSALVSSAIAYALRTPDLLIKEVKVHGIRLADRAVVEKAAKGALGQNILLLKKSPVLSRISCLSEVKDVRMGRILPNKAWIQVRERKADCVLTDTHRYYLAQADGFVFHATNGPAKGLPLVIVEKCDAVRINTHARLTQVQDALQALKYARTYKLSVDKISVDPDGDICLNMGSGFYVKLGQPDDVAQKMSMLRTTLTCKPAIAKEAVYVDLSCPSAIVWKPKAGA